MCVYVGVLKITFVGDVCVSYSSVTFAADMLAVINMTVFGGSGGMWLVLLCACVCVLAKQRYTIIKSKLDQVYYWYPGQVCQYPLNKCMNIILLAGTFTMYFVVDYF